MMFLPVLILGTWLASPSLSIHTENVGITLSHVVQEIDDMYIGVTIDSGFLHLSTRHSFYSSSKLQNYIQLLRPAYVRVGGTQGDAETYDLDGKSILTVHENGNIRWVLAASDWDELNSFVHRSGLKLIYAFNELNRKAGKWDTSNAEALLHYSSQKGYPIAGFELGNEPNLYASHNHEKVSEAQLGADFQELHRVLQSSTYKNSLLLGPDTAGYHDSFTKNFLSHGGSIVDIITFHSYYMNGDNAKLSDFTNAGKLDYLKGDVERAVATANQQHPRKVVWLGETSSAYHGGAVNISDRYVAGIMWLDKLGVGARYGLKGVMRQALVAGRYGLLNHDFDPLPDYWLTVLYKRLVGNKVFRVTTSSSNYRVYAHCTKRNNQYNYKPGSLTVYALSLVNYHVIFQFPHLEGQHKLDVFWLTPENGDLQAERVQLNGKTLTMTNGKMPSMTPHTVTSGSYMAAGKTFGFIVMPDANVAACKTSDHGTIIG